MTRGPHHYEDCDNYHYAAGAMRTRCDYEVEGRLRGSRQPVGRVPVQCHCPCSASGLPVVIRPASHDRGVARNGSLQTQPRHRALQRVHEQLNEPHPTMRTLR